MSLNHDKEIIKAGEFLSRENRKIQSFSSFDLNFGNFPLFPRPNLSFTASSVRFSLPLSALPIILASLWTLFGSEPSPCPPFSVAEISKMCVIVSKICCFLFMFDFSALKMTFLHNLFRNKYKYEKISPTIGRCCLSTGRN